jgi:hypothetical protein
MSDKKFAEGIKKLELAICIIVGFIIGIILIKIYG